VLALHVYSCYLLQVDNVFFQMRAGGSDDTNGNDTSDTPISMFVTFKDLHVANECQFKMRDDKVSNASVVHDGVLKAHQLIILVCVCLLLL
jgi:hypothetical protein